MASYKYTAETQPYKTPPDTDVHANTEKELNADGGTKGDGAYKGSDCSYTPNSSINELSYGKDGGKAAALGKVPEVVANSFEVAPLPKAFTGNFQIGENKNVSTPVTGG